MKTGSTRCPVCTRRVRISANGLMEHHQFPANQALGAGKRNLGTCKGSQKRPEEVR